ncbi:MAG TPA: hypothetical protein PL080_07495, partial [Candidatus Syntrophosphaera thermopropionivorans]|nr:hypothetical protein [Candidatus Syntrophosphaera thermopropionivorans]
GIKFLSTSFGYEIILRKIRFFTKLQNKYLGHLHNLFIYTTVRYNLSTSLFCGNALIMLFFGE